jgi:hypothetical protein
MRKTAFTPDARVRDLPGFLALKNIVSVSLFRWRWHMQGGSGSWRARSMRDMRTEQQAARWRRIEFQVHELRHGREARGAVVVDFIRWKAMQKRVA